jgi:hypothetical protein
MKHYVITRFNLGYMDNVPDPEGWLKHRCELFERYTYPSMMRQTCKDFVWLVMFDPETPEEIAARYEGIIPVYGDMEEAKSIVRKGISRPIITSRLDSDDYVEEYWIKGIQNVARICKNDTVIDYHGRAYHEGTEVFYEVKRNKPTSMFLSLVEFGRPETCYVHHHPDMFRHYGSIYLPMPGWVMVVHDNNLINSIQLGASKNIPQSFYL